MLHRRTPLNVEAIRAIRGDRIRQARTLRGYSQDQLAVLVGVTKGSISSWENGKTDPTIKNELRIADALGVAWSNLFHITEVA